MLTSLIYVAGSVSVLVVLLLLYAAEDAQGRRILMPTFRSHLDTLCVLVYRRIRMMSAFFGNGFVRLLLHYGVHSVLKRVLSFLRVIESKLEALARRNRKIAKDISGQKTKNHLDAIAEHQEEFALTETQKKKLRSH